MIDDLIELAGIALAFFIVSAPFIGIAILVIMLIEAAHG